MAVAMSGREEAKGGFVDAVAEVSGFGAVGEDVAEVGGAAAAGDFGAFQHQADVFAGADVGGLGGGPEAGPAGAGVELFGGAEEEVVAADAAVFARGFEGVVGAGEGDVGAALAGDVILLAGEAGAAIGVTGRLVFLAPAGGKVDEPGEDAGGDEERASHCSIVSHMMLESC